MATVTNLYANALCTNPIYQLQPGQAGLVGYWADPANWNIQQINTGKTDDQDNPLYIRATYINKDKNGASVSQGCDFGLAASGGAILYDLRTAEDSFEVLDDVILSDTVNNGTAQAFTNAFFSGVIDYGEDLKRSAFVRFSNGIYNRSVFVQVGSYRQTPADADKDQRQTWNYETSDGYYAATQMFCRSFQAEIAANSQWGFVRVYSLVVGGVDCYAFFVGVDFAGGFNDTGNYTSYIIAIPKDLYKDKIPRPYVGPVSKDSAATSFTPTAPYHDSIAGRDLTGKRNPIGFNSGNGLRLLQLDNAGYSQILYGIYSGSSSSLLNYAGQLIDQVTGGEGHRPAEEVQPMTQGVLCCHIVPAIATYGSGIYNLKSIAGYRLSLAGVPGLLCGQHIYSYTSPAVSVAPRLNSFLDYEPYTSIICHLPFFGDISVSPSALLGNAIQAEYELDIYTGILSCNLFIITPESRYIISTQQSKISTDLPVIGAAANQNAIGTIAQATGGLARARMQQARAQEIGTQAEQAAAAANTAASAAAGAVTTVDALSRAGNAVPVGGSSVEGIGNYLVTRAAYLIITRPQPSLPESFAQLYGAVSNISGTVSSFSGYTEFAAVDLRGIDATDAEKSQILALLRGGVFV